jgi:ERCC4-type nuclease
MKNPDFTIIVDTREQQPWSFDNFAVANKKLDTGDYSIEGLQHLLCIERKKSISEFANNIIESRFKDVVIRMSQLKYSFLLLEFSLEDVLIYPIGSTVPKRMWDKIKISPAFLLKNLLELQLNHNIIVYFCGNASDAEKMAEYIFKKIYYIEKQNIKNNQNQSEN